MYHIASPDCTDPGIERELNATCEAPRITMDDVENHIAQEYYFTGEDGVVGAGKQIPSEALTLLTFCVLVLRNGFTVTGESACVSAANFDAEIGRRIARQNAVQKMWSLMGYHLKQRLHERFCLDEANTILQTLYNEDRV